MQRLSGNKIRKETLFLTPIRKATNQQVRSGVFEKSAHHCSSLENAPLGIICGRICSGPGLLKGDPGHPEGEENEGRSHDEEAPAGRGHSLLPHRPLTSAYPRPRATVSRRRSRSATTWRQPPWPSSLRCAPTSRACRPSSEASSSTCSASLASSSRSGGGTCSCARATPSTATGSHWSKRGPLRDRKGLYQKSLSLQEKLGLSELLCVF